MKNFTVEITDEEEKALLTDMVSIQDWLDNAIHNKARMVINIIIQEQTDKQPKKISKEDKEILIRDMTLQTAEERNAIELAEMRVRSGK